MRAYLLCAREMWRQILVLLATIALVAIAEAKIEDIVQSVIMKAGTRHDVEQLPEVITWLRFLFFMYALSIVVVLFSVVSHAYLCYLKLYPRFVRGGWNAAAFFAGHTKYPAGCPKAGYEVAVMLSVEHFSFGA